MQKTITLDDLDQTSEATHLGVRLALNDVSRQLDLSEQHWNELNEILAPYIRAGVEYVPPAPPAKRKLNHDERNSLLSWARHVEGRDIKRITQDDIQRWTAYVAERDAKLLATLDEPKTEETPEVTAPTPSTTGRRRQKD